MSGTTSVPVERPSRALPKILKHLRLAQAALGQQKSLFARLGSSEISMGSARGVCEFGIGWAGENVMRGQCSSAPSLEFYIKDWIRGEWESDFGVRTKLVAPFHDDAVPELVTWKLSCAVAAAPLSPSALWLADEIRDLIGSPFDALWEEIVGRKPGNEANVDTLMTIVAGPMMSVVLINTLWKLNARPVDVQTAISVAIARHGKEKIYNTHRRILGRSHAYWSELQKFAKRPTADYGKAKFVRNALQPVFSSISTLAHGSGTNLEIMIAEEILVALEAKGVVFRQHGRRW